MGLEEIVSTVYLREACLGRERLGERLAAFSRYQVHLPPERLLVVLQTAEETLTQVDELKRPLDAEHVGLVRLGWSWEKRKAQRKAIEAARLAGRDSLKSRLAPEEFREVERWIRTSILPSLTIEVAVE